MQKGDDRMLAKTRIERRPSGRINRLDHPGQGEEPPNDHGDANGGQEPNDNPQQTGNSF